MPKGFIKVNEVYCKGCGVCIASCPWNALGLANHLNRAGYHPAEQISEKCTGCASCALVCPEAAITVLREIPAAKLEKRIKEKCDSEKEN